MNPDSILLLLLHGHEAAEPGRSSPNTDDQVLYVMELAKRFSRLGYKIDLVTRQFKNQPEFDEINQSLRVWRIPFGDKKSILRENMHDYIGDFVTNCLAAIRSRGRQYGIVYSHFWDAGWAGQKIAEELNLPHVHTPHSLGWWEKHHLTSNGMTEAEVERQHRFEERIRLEFLVFRNCDHIVATTQPQAELLLTQYDVLERQVTVIPPGMDENRFSPFRQEEWQKLQAQYDLGGHDVLTVGRLAPNKGYDLLIQAMPTFLKLIPDARLIAAVGSDGNATKGEEAVAELQSLAEQTGIADRVRWLSYIPDEDLANYYRAAGVFALPSRYEPFGMNAIEAMACGTSTIVTVHSGLAESIEFGHQALYADPQRPGEFGAIMALPMLYPDLAHELSVEGSRFARRSFGWTGIAKRILEVFKWVETVRQEQAFVVG